MYQHKLTLKGIGIYFSDQDHLYTTSRSINDCTITQRNEKLETICETTVHFSSYAQTPSKIYFADHNNHKTGVINKENFEINYGPYHLTNLSNAQLIPGHEKYIGSIFETGFGIYDLQQLKIEKLIFPTVQNHFVTALPMGFLMWGGYQSPSYIGYFDYDGNAIWEKDLGGEANYQDNTGKIKKANIRSPFLYETSVIVIAGKLITRIEMTTGKTIWQIQHEKYGWPGNLFIRGNIGYCQQNYSYAMFDLEKGIELPRPPELKNIIFNGEPIVAIGNKFALHDDLFWHIINNNEGNILAAIIPETAEYAWHMPVEAYGMLDTPGFYKNYLLMVSDEGWLVVNEKT